MPKYVKNEGVVKALADLYFSLSCVECDAGSGIESRSEAHAEGWTGIFYDDGPSWNFLGMCPDCYLKENGRNPPRRRIKKS